MEAPTTSAPDPAALRTEWDVYWAGQNHDRTERSVYDLGAAFYRHFLIEPLLTRVITREFPPGARLLHAGCGGGVVDKNVVARCKVTALDISPNALAAYQARHPGVDGRLGNIFDLSDVGETYDGVYNLGVMEHFEPEQIVAILKQFAAVLKPGGKLVLLWPPVYGLSVIALHGIHFVLNRILRRDIQLHPPEPTKVSSRRQVEGFLQAAGFRLRAMNFGPSDAFTYVIVVADKA